MNFDGASPNPRKTTSVRHLGRVDVARLKEAVLAIPESVWAEEDSKKPNRFDTLDKTEHIIFRMVSSNFLDWRNSEDRPLWSEWKPLLAPVLDAATAPFGYSRAAFPRVMLARMAPGGVIQPHFDSNLAAKWPHKIHVPLLTNPDVTFFVNRVPHHFAEGEAVEVNNMGPHAVKNEGSTDRIHLIIEYYDLGQPEPEWLAQVATQAAQAG
jgi:hypothetical protein